jgi:hypothetical protein
VDKPKSGIPIEALLIGGGVIVVIAVFASQSSSGYTYAPGETQTAATILAANQAAADRQANLTLSGAQLAVGYQESVDTNQTSLSLANLSAQTELSLAQLEAQSNYSLASLNDTNALAALRAELNLAHIQSDNQTTQARIGASAQKTGDLFSFLGSLASGFLSFVTAGASGAAGAATAAAPAP